MAMATPKMLLTMKDLPVLSQKLLPIAAQWNSLGIQLGFDPGELRIIQQQAFFDPVNALNGLLEKWLNRTDPPSTLETIINVVGGAVIANGQLSKKLRQDCADFPSVHVHVRSKQPGTSASAGNRLLPRGLNPYPDVPPATSPRPVAQKCSGYYRGQLHQLSQRGEVTHLQYEERDHDKGFTATVTFMQQGSLKKFQSRGVHTSKSSADESAAECAVSRIGSSTKAPPSKRSKLMGQAMKTASTVTTSVTLRPRPGPAAKPGTCSDPSVSPPNRTHVSKLKEYCEQQKWPQPTYTLIPQPEEQQFRYQAMVKTPTRSFTAMGSVCRSKSDAKHSAAQAVLRKLPKI